MPLLKVIDLRERLRGMSGGSRVGVRKRQTALGLAVGKQKPAFIIIYQITIPAKSFSLGPSPILGAGGWE